MKNRCEAAFLVLYVGLPVNADNGPSWRGPTGQGASAEKDVPTYRVAREADVTVVLFVKRKVQATFGF